MMKTDVLNAIIERASQIWERNQEDLGEETAFVEFEPKSAHYAQMTTYLEDKYDLEVPYMKFKRCKTLGDAADYVVELLEE